MSSFTGCELLKPANLRQCILWNQALEKKSWFWQRTCSLAFEPLLGAAADPTVHVYPVGPELWHWPPLHPEALLLLEPSVWTEQCGSKLSGRLCRMKVEIPSPQKASNSHTEAFFFFPFSTHIILHKNGKWTATLLGLFHFVLIFLKNNFIYF